MTATAAPATSQRALATALFDSFNNRDLNAWVSVVAPNAEFNYPGFRATNRDAALAYNAPFLAAFSDLHFQYHFLMIDGNRTVVKLTGRGTHDGPLVTPAGTFPATGRRIHVDGISVVESRDGQIVVEETYWDRIGMLEQMGVA